MCQASSCVNIWCVKDCCVEGYYQLKEEGYVINSVQNKGYRITEYPDIITASEIESLLLDDDGNMQGICQHIKYFDRNRLN